MKDYDEIKEGTDRGGSWATLPNIMAGVVLVFFLLLAIGLKYIGGLESESTQTTTSTPVTTTTPATTTPEPTTVTSDPSQISLEELLEREQKLESQIKELKEFAGIRTRIISELKAAFDATDIEMNINETTGDIRLSEALLFGVGMENLSRGGEEYLRDFIPVFVSVILSPQNRQYIDQIIVEGHSDDEGTYLDNLALSQRRAVSVVSYIFRNDLNQRDDGFETDKYFSVSGRAFAMLVTENGQIDRTMSRRVEFKFTLKDSDFIEQMIEIYEGE